MFQNLNIEGKLPSLNEFFAALPNVQTVYLFGSYGTEYQTPDSDIDFAILFTGDMHINQEAMLLNQLSIVLDTDRVDLLNLNKAPIRLQFAAIADGRIIHEKNYIATCDYTERVINLYQDYSITLNKFYKDYDASLREAYEDG